MKFFDEKNLTDLHNMNANAELEEERIKKNIDERIQIMFQQFLFSYDIFKDALKEYPVACCKIGIQPRVIEDVTHIFFGRKKSAYKLEFGVLVSEYGKLYEEYRDSGVICYYPVNDEFLRKLFFEVCDGYIKRGQRDLWGKRRDERIRQEPHIVEWVGRVAGNFVKGELPPLYDFECYEKSQIESNIQKLLIGFIQNNISKS